MTRRVKDTALTCGARKQSERSFSSLLGRWVRDLEPEGGGDGGDVDEEAPGMGEYSYPSLVEFPAGVVHVSYTFRRETVRYCRISEKWITQGPGTAGLYKPP